MRKKILFIFPYNTWGGAFRSTYILSNYLIKRGWQVDIIFPIIPPRNGYKILSIKDVSQISARAQKSALHRKSAHPYDHIDKQVPFLNKRPSPPSLLSQVVGLLQTPVSIASPF